LQTREEIRRIQQETGITTVFVTHDQEEAMSISDEIVVMKLGEEQQIDSPQKVYNSPKNLFVAKFLGTPPINVFEGEVKKARSLSATMCVFETKTALEDQPLYVAIRPEGLVVCKDSKTPSFRRKSPGPSPRPRSLYRRQEPALPPADLQSHHSKQ
jgi:multiple sugar transport system ATP-binding protein